mmetsp:Transcript_37865/g.91274  ORF Transcript_37865/g.91274 Transcript_37865/m.91274 type:complete len:252 (+) Transcript_37865:641-1396(+)
MTDSVTTGASISMSTFTGLLLKEGRNPPMTSPFCISARECSEMLMVPSSSSSSCSSISLPSLSSIPTLMTFSTMLSLPLVNAEISSPLSIPILCTVSSKLYPRISSCSSLCSHMGCIMSIFTKDVEERHRLTLLCLKSVVVGAPQDDRSSGRSLTLTTAESSLLSNGMESAEDDCELSPSVLRLNLAGLLESLLLLPISSAFRLLSNGLSPSRLLLSFSSSRSIPAAESSRSVGSIFASDGLPSPKLSSPI